MRALKRIDAALAPGAEEDQVRMLIRHWTDNSLRLGNAPQAAHLVELNCDPMRCCSIRLPKRLELPVRDRSIVCVENPRDIRCKKRPAHIIREQIFDIVSWSR